MVNDVPKIVPALNTVLYFSKNLADLVFDGVWPGGLGFEAVQVGEELAVDELDEVVAGEGGVVVYVAALVFRRGPRFPAVGFSYYISQPRLKAC